HNATSGVTTPASYTFSDGSPLSHDGVTVTDTAGNTSAMTAGFTGIKQDTVAPTVSESINAVSGSDGWYNATGAAVITYTATDASAGVVTPSAYTLSGGSVLSHAGLTNTNDAGNVSTATHAFTGIKPD